MPGKARSTRASCSDASSAGASSNHAPQPGRPLDLPRDRLASVLDSMLDPFILLAAVLSAPWGPGFRLLAVYPLLVGVLFNLSGLHIDVQDARQQIYLHFS